MTTTEREAQAEDMARRTSTPPTFHRGYFAAWRTDDFLELLGAKPNAFRLLTLIAYRARWRDGYSSDGLARGEARIGRFDVQRELGLTPKEYRLACDTLEQGNFVALQRTHHGTVARLVDSRIFSPTAPEEGTQEGTGKGTPRAHGGHTEGHKEEKEKGKKEESSKLQRAKPDAAEDAKEVDRYDESEAGIVARFKALLGKAAAANDGGKWRVRFREQRDKTLRVLQACESDHREGRRPDVSWAAYAEDTWKRFAQSHRNPNSPAHARRDNPLPATHPR